MDHIEITGYIAALLTTAANVPQAAKIIKTRSAKDVSTITYSMLAAGFVFWITYGIMQNDLPIILANGISLLVSATILFLKYIPQRLLQKLSTKAKSL